MENLLNLDSLGHFSAAALLAATATVFIYLHQCRRYFSQIRQDFIAFQRQNNTKKKTKGTKVANPDDNTFIIGFFHPHCSSGGGGERVLWKAIQALGELKEGKLMD